MPSNLRPFARGALLLLLLLLAPLAARATGEISYEGRASFPADAEYIDFGPVRVRDWDGLPAFLRQFPNLRRVDMFDSPIAARRANALHAACPEIKFGWTLRITSYDHHEHRVRTDATAFSTLHNNRSTEHTDEELSVLRFCTELRALDIGHNAATNLDFLYSLPELRVLIIALNQVTDLTPVGSLTHLEYLEMFRNRVTDLSPLSGLTHLMDLNICYNRVEDVTPLYPLTGLQRLWLNHAQYYQYGDSAPDLPKARVQALREALPDTQIDEVSAPTAGGWRAHPRYDVIFEMFKRGEYLPFSPEAEVKNDP